MSGRALIVMVVGIIVISSNVFLQLTNSSKQISANVDQAYMRETAMNIAESGAGIGIRKVADDPSFRGPMPMVDLFKGNAIVEVYDTLYLNKPAICVECTGIVNLGGTNEHRETTMAYLYGDTIPSIIKAVVTTTHDVDTDPGFDCDGRDHDSSDNVRSSCGTKAVWTEGSCHEGSPGSIKGTDDNTDSDANAASDSVIVRDHQSYSGSFPTSPDSVMSTCGVPFAEGKMKSIAQSAQGGSQYATDPLTLTYPLSGVTYVEIPSGSTWTGANVTGTGVLVIHNATHDACVQDVNTGPFTGLIIADEIVHTNCAIHGAVVSIGCRGDSVASGSGCVHFCKKKVKDECGKIVRTYVIPGSQRSAIAWRQVMNKETLTIP